MRWLLAGLLIAHGIAHVVGFVVPWKILTSKEMPYRTTILASSVDLGETGARLLGRMWLGVGQPGRGGALLSTGRAHFPPAVQGRGRASRRRACYLARGQ